MRQHLLIGALCSLGTVLTVPAYAQSRTDRLVDRLVIGAVAGTALGDLYQTGAVFKRFPQAREGNPLIAWSRTPLGHGIEKGAITAWQIEGLHWLTPRRKWAARAIGLGTIALNGYAIRHNRQLLEHR